MTSVSRGLGGGDDAELLHHAEAVAERPYFGNFAVLDAKDAHAGEGDVFAGGGQAVKFALVRGADVLAL